MSTTRWFFLRNNQTINKKKYTPSREENKMAVDRKREADGDYLSFGMQNDFFLRVALS